MSSQCLGRNGKSNCIVAESAELVVRLAAGSLSFSAPCMWTLIKYLYHHLKVKNSSRNQ